MDRLDEERPMIQKRNAWARGVVAALAMAGAFVSLGCDDTNNVVTPPDFAMTQKLPDLSMPMQATDGGAGDMAEKPDADCFDNPMTHLQIINACTTSMKVAKPTNPTLPFVNGQLPPLP
jgi:hypothetical protein